MIAFETGYRFRCDRPGCDVRSPALREDYAMAEADAEAHENIMHEGEPRMPLVISGCKFTWMRHPPAVPVATRVQCTKPSSSSHGPYHWHAEAWVQVGYEQQYADEGRWLE